MRGDCRHKGDGGCGCGCFVVAYQHGLMMAVGDRNPGPANDVPFLACVRGERFAFLTCLLAR